jgi:cytochrome c
MSDNLGFNKIAGAVLVTGLVLVGLPQLADMIYEHKAPAKPGYALEVQETAEPGAPAGPEVPPDWGTVLPTADIAAGKAQAAKCQSCHNLDKGGPNQTGPNLWGVLGRKPGSHPGFAYSGAMTDFGAKTPAWDYQHVFEFVKSPQAYINGTKMTFVGIKKAEDRVNLIAYLRTLNDSPPPIPAPNPAAAKAAAPASGAPASATPGSPVAASGTAAGKPAVVATGGPSTNAAGQAQAPKSGAAAAPTAQKQNPGNSPG